jgi:hypothetical protein
MDVEVLGHQLVETQQELSEPKVAIPCDLLATGRSATVGLDKESLRTDARREDGAIHSRNDSCFDELILPGRRAVNLHPKFPARLLKLLAAQ